MEVSENLLNPTFVNDAMNLSYMIKSSRSKVIKGNQMGSKIAALSLDPLTKSINKQGRVNTSKMYHGIHSAGLTSSKPSPSATTTTT